MSTSQPFVPTAEVVTRQLLTTILPTKTLHDIILAYHCPAQVVQRKLQCAPCPPDGKQCMFFWRDGVGTAQLVPDVGKGGAYNVCIQLQRANGGLSMRQACIAYAPYANSCTFVLIHSVFGLGRKPMPLLRTAQISKPLCIPIRYIVSGEANERACISGQPMLANFNLVTLGLFLRNVDKPIQARLHFALILTSCRTCVRRQSLCTSSNGQECWGIFDERRVGKFKYENERDVIKMPEHFLLPHPARLLAHGNNMLFCQPAGIWATSDADVRFTHYWSPVGPPPEVAASAIDGGIISVRDARRLTVYRIHKEDAVLHRIDFHRHPDETMAIAVVGRDIVLNQMHEWLWMTDYEKNGDDLPQRKLHLGRSDITQILSHPTLPLAAIRFHAGTELYVLHFPHGLEYVE